MCVCMCVCVCVCVCKWCAVCEVVCVCRSGVYICIATSAIIRWMILGNVFSVLLEQRPRENHNLAILDLDTKAIKNPKH